MYTDYTANIKVVFRVMDDDRAEDCVRELLDEMKHDIRECNFPVSEEVVVSATVEKLVPEVVAVFSPANYR